MCLAVSLFSQKGAECSANAGPDQTICYGQALVLEAPESADYYDPLDLQWSTTSTVTFSNQNGYITNVTKPGPGGGYLDVGTYTFQFCARCKDLNGDGTRDLVCDEVVVTVTPEPTPPTITEPDGTQDGHFTACTEADITVSAPGAGEMSSVSILPDDGLVVATITGNTVHLQRLDTNSPTQGECNYEISYIISNGGCSQRTSVKATFIRPQDPNNDGIIEGTISPCPSCTNTLFLRGDRPGCGGQGVWTMIASPAGATVDYGTSVNTTTGDATAVVSLPGNYTFQYTVTNIAPCANSVYTVSCTVYQIGSFSVGQTVIHTFCDNVAPAGVYNYTYNQLNNAIYSWEVVGVADPSQVVVTYGANHSIDITLLSDQSVIPYFYVSITATKYFIDPDCEGPKPIMEVTLPYNNPAQNQAYIQTLLNTPGICIYSCESTEFVYFVGAPKLNIQSEDIYFLCSDGSETVRLSDYFSVTNGVSYSTEINLIGSPPTGGSTLPAYISANELLSLSVDDCGEYIFEIVVKSYNYNVLPPVVCTTTGYLSIIIEEAKPVTAGTDQVKACCTETIRLNGNDPFSCGAQGTWTLLGCSSGCTVEIVDPHDPNTQVYVEGECNEEPITMQFQWSFSSQDPTCNLSDVTQVVVNPCIPTCDSLDIDVLSECLDSTVELTVVDEFGAVLNPFLYTITWVVDGNPYTGNPVSVLYPGHTVVYSVDAALIYHDEKLCFARLTDSVTCKVPPHGCGIWIEESCDECGNVILTAVDENGDLVVPTPYVHNFRWVVYGGGPGDNSGLPPINNMNPITVAPGSCYSLLYEHFYYRPGSDPIPGTWDSICRLELPITCVTTNCPGPCENFPDFFIAGCGDMLDVSLGLTFPSPCYNVCASAYSGSATLGVFYVGSNLPVDPNLYNIVWENNAVGTYVNGILSQINSVTITSKANRCCEWADGYQPFCCDRIPQNIQCEQPIVKHCYENGTVTYTPGAPQITWTGVAGAIGYELEITQGDAEGCCEGSGNVEYITVTGSPWVFPSNYDCFVIRIRALFPEGTCPTSNWSATFLYCEREIVCPPVIIVCGCCGDRSAESTVLNTQVVSEPELLDYLKKNPGPGYPTLDGALTAMGMSAYIEPGFKVFPNPVSTALVIKPGSAVKGNYLVEVHDMLQRQWQKQEFESGAESTLDVSNLPDGIYLLSIRNAAGELLLTEKITVLR